MNDSRVLMQFSVYKKVQQEGLFVVENGSLDGFPPYILVDKDCLLLRWIMNPLKDGRQLFVVKSLKYAPQTSKGE